MKITPGNAQHIGRRKEQQDAFSFSHFADRQFIAHGGILAVVADGMGGLEKGGVSSRIAVRSFVNAYIEKSPDEFIPQALKRALHTAYDAVCHMAQDYDTGTTLVAAVVADMHLYWISVGDSRLYLYRKTELIPLTQDHNVAAKLADAVRHGMLSETDAENYPNSHALTSYLGAPELNDIDQNTTPYPLVGGDWLLLCSDGVYGALPQTELGDALWGVPQEAAEHLIQKVLRQNRPHQDNATAVIMACIADLDMAEGDVRTRRRTLYAMTVGLLTGIVFFVMIQMAPWLSAGSFLSKLSGHKAFADHIPLTVEKPSFSVSPIIDSNESLLSNQSDLQTKLSEEPPSLISQPQSSSSVINLLNPSRPGSSANVQQANSEKSANKPSLEKPGTIQKEKGKTQPKKLAKPTAPKKLATHPVSEDKGHKVKAVPQIKKNRPNNKSASY